MGFDESRLTQDEQVQRANLAALVAAYETLRRERSQARNRIERALGLELSRYGPFRLAGKVWQWSHTQDSIICRPALATAHPHGAKPRESIEDEIPQSSRRRCGREAGKGQSFGGWSIKGRSL